MSARTDPDRRPDLAGRGTDPGIDGDRPPELDQAIPDLVGSLVEEIEERCAADTFDEAGPERPSEGTATAVAAVPRTDWPRVPGYEITERLGEGGMGVVYGARQVGLNRRVALKMIRGGAQARLESVARFRIEAEAVARLRHPHIVQIFDIGEVEGSPFVSLELLEGGTLADRLAATPQPGRPAAELVATLALAIDHAHRSGIIHRDLKPTNVLFTVDGTPKIADFGLAKRIDAAEHPTESGQIMGSPSYMAPEQAWGHSRDIGPAADVYALGAILYEMLTGRPPFKGETAFETIRQLSDDDPVPPSRLVPRVARDLETICLKCLNKDPARRYASAQALADDLGRYTRGEPIKARPTPFWERGSKWARRHPMRAAAAILVVLLTLGMIAAIRRDGQIIVARQTTGLSLLLMADAARSQDELEQAQLKLAEFVPVIKNEPRLKFLAHEIARRQARISRALDDLKVEQEKRDQLQAERERFQKFRSLRNETQLYAAHLMVLDPAEHRKALRAKTSAALEVYGQADKAVATAWSLALPSSSALSAALVAEVKEGCYDLLLIRAEAEEPAEGLKILDRAVSLRPATTTAYHRVRALCLGRMNDKSGRAREEQLARDTKPARAFDHLLIGREQLATHQERAAFRSSEAALRLDPSQFGAHLLRAMVRFNTQNFSEARNSLDLCIRTAPELMGLYLFRALISGEEGNRALVKVKENPTTATDWQQEAAETFKAAEADYRQALESRPDANFRYVLLINRGGMYLQAGKLDLALADAEAAIGLADRPYHAHALLAQIYEKEGRLDQARLALDRAIERQPDRPELFRARAYLVAPPPEKRTDKTEAVTPAQRDRAITDLERAIRLASQDSPQTADDHAERGRLYFARGQTAEALAAYDAALRIVPDDLKTIRLRTVALLEQEKYDDVLAASDAFLARGKPSVELLEIRGQARFARKDFTGAIADYTVALSLTPRSSVLLAHRGWAYLFSDAFRLALADFDASLRLDPSLGDAYSGRGLAHVGLGNWREAVADADKAVQSASAKHRQRAYFNAARIHALSLRFAADEVSRRGETALALYRRLRQRAGTLLQQSAQELAPDKRAPFWREVVASDPALRPFLASKP